MPEETQITTEADLNEIGIDAVPAGEEASDETPTEQVGKSDTPKEGEASPAEELTSLREEVSALKAQLAEERALYSRVNAECAEFAQLYPGIPLSSLTDGIWESVKRGVPIAAAYALEERRAAIADMKANAVNSTNRLLSSGSIDPHASEEYYSPEEVRSMSPAEVRANYSKIISSMQKWH